jgi:hypothetical protein
MLRNALRSSSDDCWQHMNKARHVCACQCAALMEESTSHDQHTHPCCLKTSCSRVSRQCLFFTMMDSVLAPHVPGCWCSREVPKNRLNLFPSYCPALWRLLTVGKMCPAVTPKQATCTWQTSAPSALVLRAGVTATPIVKETRRTSGRWSPPLTPRCLCTDMKMSHGGYNQCQCGMQSPHQVIVKGRQTFVCYQ